MSSNINVLQVIPKLGYGGAETGCYDLAHYLHEQKCKSYILTSGGELIKYIDRKKVKLIRLPVHSKNPFMIIINSIAIVALILFFNISVVHARSRAPAWSCLFAHWKRPSRFFWRFQNPGAGSLSKLDCCT